MCKRGDIIVVDNYKSQGRSISRHSFVVIDDQNGEILGFDFDFIAVVMSSFKDEEQRKKKLRYPGNYPISTDNSVLDPGANQKDGYIKAEQFYYFKREKLSYRVIGYLEEEVFNDLLNFIERLIDEGLSIEQIIDNL